jgi:acyl-CoA thioester hydrolase
MDGGTWPLLRDHVIRWSECDLYGHVNHAAYLTIFEDMRIAHWEALTGLPISPGRPGPVVGQIEAKYHRAAGFGEKVVLGSRVLSFRRTSFIHDYAMWRDGVACCTGRAICVVTRNDTGEKVPLWPELRERMLAEGAVAEG